MVVKMIAQLYETTLRWSKNEKAPFYLAGVSFLDSSVFPLSPLFMIIPMSITKPEKAFHYAFIATFFSLLGALLGYGLGFWAEGIVLPLMQLLHIEAAYQSAQAYLVEENFWAIFIAGFTPLPFKVLTIGAGIFRLQLGSFLAASLLGRGLRFLMVAMALRWGGPHIEPLIKKNLPRLSWFILGLGLLLMIYKTV